VLRQLGLLQTPRRIWRLILSPGGASSSPWGHLQAGAVVRDLTLNDGEYLNKSWLGYGGALSGNFLSPGARTI